MSDLGLSEHRVRIQRLIITVSSHHLMDFLWASNKSHRHFIGSMPIKSHQKVKYKSRCISLSTLRCPTVELIVNHHVPIQSHHKFHDQHPYQTHDNATSILNLIKSNYSLTHWWFQPIWMILYIYIVRIIIQTRGLTCFKMKAHETISVANKLVYYPQ